ncbi:O-methyltransferase-domain-containing protein [Achaetomium macrosporum]|uniref:O-methyltransferase-domain-containing protein n=1 Tax=Achaetomium macrosporum TaxID=79813 RepID=A0AAN7C492_9PEZI|nr:O-methyltransferase-domain-containing protein [Achaetomium macrosporum]
MDSTIADKLDTLAQTLSRVAQNLRVGTTSLRTDTTQRMKLVQTGEDLINTVSQPEDKVHLYLPQLCHLTALRLFLKWGAFDKIPQGMRPNGQPLTISYFELAGKLGADVSLITRLGKVLVANGTLEQHVDVAERVAHTPFSHLLTTPQQKATMELLFEDHLPALMALPPYFDHFGRIEPKDRLQTPVAFAAGKLGSTAWDIIHSDDRRRKTFMLAMSTGLEWAVAQSTYDFSWLVKEIAKHPEDRVLFVDVGGGRGQVLKKLFQAHPALPRHQCALEDLPDIIDQAKRDEPELADVQMVGMDFHKEQPIKGALVYYIRRCLHDYSDEACVGILQQIANAMVSDSKLLISETVINNPPTAYQGAMDLMMLLLSGKERTLDTFKEMVERAGLMVTQACVAYEGSGIIECVLA